MELLAYQDALVFDPEHQLASEPLKIDCVVIKKVKDVVIEKNIAAIFRKWNILEYKGPGDYVSVDDFYKVYAYTCLYKSLEHLPVTDLTVSFVERHYPRKLLDHLTGERGYKIAETSPGIYTVIGDIFPIQVIDSRKLSTEENLWLKSLSDDLDIKALKKVRGEIVPMGKDANIGAYCEAILRANYKTVQEAMKMGDAQTFEVLFEKAGWTDKWRAEGEAIGKAEGKAEGEEQKALAIAQNLIDLGLPIETVITATGLDPEKVKTMYKTNNK